MFGFLQVKAEAAAAASFEEELQRHAVSLRLQLRVLLEGTVLQTSPSTAADGTGVNTPSDASDNAVLSAYELLPTQFQHVLPERKTAQNLTEEH
jgi:hypothetical protein